MDALHAAAAEAEAGAGVNLLDRHGRDDVNIGDAKDRKAAASSAARRRIGLVLAFQLCLLVAAKVSGLADGLNRHTVRQWVQDSGAVGLLTFPLLFAAAELANIPGILFVAAAVLAYGALVGGASACTMLVYQSLYTHTALHGGHPVCQTLLGLC